MDFEVCAGAKQTRQATRDSQVAYMKHMNRQQHKFQVLESPQADAKAISKLLPGFLTPKQEQGWSGTKSGAAKHVRALASLTGVLA